MRILVLVAALLFSVNLLAQDVFNQGVEYFKNQKYDEAIVCFDKLLDDDLNNPQYNLWIGKAYYEKVKTASHFERGIISGKVLSHLQKTVKIDTTNIEARIILGNYYLYAPSIGGGSVKKAEEMANELSVYSPEQALELKAKIYQKQGRTEDSIKEYQKFLELNPDNTDVMYGLGMVCQGEKMYKEAFKWFEMAVNHDSEDYGSLYQIGRTAVLSETNLDSGIKSLKTFIQKNPGSPHPSSDAAFWRLGMLYEIKNETEKAKEAYRSALELKPGDKKYLDALENLQ